MPYCFIVFASAGHRGWRQGHHRVEFALHPLSALAARALSQSMSPPRQHESAQQQHLHSRREDAVACLDGELAVAQLVRQADLPVLGMSLLGAVEVRDPDRRTVPIHHLADDTRAAAVADDVDHHLAVLEHPVPVGQGPAFWRWVETPEAEPYIAAFIEQQRPPKPREDFHLIGGFDDDEGLSILDTTDFAWLTAEIEAKYGDACEGGA